MVNTKPNIVKEFEGMIKDNAVSGTYRVNIDGIQIDVFPYVFPPSSPFSRSSYVIYNGMNNLNGERVLDIGTGTGIQAIQTVLAGAIEVDAVDINEDAVECARHNVRLNGLDEIIKVWQSDLFDSIPEKEYDLIVTNLPIMNMEEKDIRLHSLYDPGFIYHERLFKEAKTYLNSNGRIFLSHANLQEDGFRKIGELARKHGFSFRVIEAVNYFGYEWRNYEFRLGGEKWK